MLTTKQEKSTHCELKKESIRLCAISSCRAA